MKYSTIQKQEIANKIKDISLFVADDEFAQLQTIDVSKCSDRCQIGNNVVDYFTFVQRLEVKGKYNASFFDFLANIEEFKKKKFIANMLVYYATVKNKNGQKNETKVLKEVYNICISAINIFRPLVAMEIYQRFRPHTVLDMCAGWGGRLVGAAALNVSRYIGIEINTDLKPGYDAMTDFLKERSTTEVQMLFQSAASINYATLPEYDMVLTSPPYYFLEKYANNEHYVDKEDMNERFYKPMILGSFQHLKSGGHYCINVNAELYTNVFVPILGLAQTIIPLKKSKRQNDYGENIYVWISSGFL
jgi:hypothetical protein